MQCQCPVCASHSTSEAFRQEDVPVHQNRIFGSRQEARDERRGTLSMHLCHRCGFVFNAAFDAQLLDYSVSYDNAQHHSQAFSCHLDAMKDRIASSAQSSTSRILEVGCGQGTFLKSLIRSCPAATVGIGYDPAYRGEDSAEGGRLSFIRDYFRAAPGHSTADIVISRHVIEHIPHPMPFLTSMKDAMADSQNSRIFLETPCIEWIIHKRVFWDFFYEHCSYWSADSLSRALQGAGLRAANVSRVFDGQYLWLEATRDTLDTSIADAQDEFVEKFLNYSRCYVRDIETMTDAMRDWAQRETTAVWGAGAKGATCVNLVDPQGMLIDCIVDVNRNKQGKFVGGTGHPIVSPFELRSRGVTRVIVMNPNYLAEIAAECSRSCPNARVSTWEQGAGA